MVGFVPVIKPVKVALLRAVGELRRKSSADSISILPEVSGREAVAIKPSTSPVEKLKLWATVGAGRSVAAPTSSHAGTFARMRLFLSQAIHAEQQAKPDRLSILSAAKSAPK